MDRPEIFGGLLVRPRPFASEGRWEFWLRLAHENGLKRPQWLLTPDCRWPTGVVRVCPDCIRAADAHWRQDWSGRESFWCSRHAQWLLDECPSCRRRLRWSRIRFQECVCGFDLREACARAVNPAILTAVRTRTAPVAVLRVLGALALHGPMGKVGKKADRTTVDEARAQLEAGINVASGWPSKFVELLDKHRTPASGEGIVQLLRDALPGFANVASLIADVDWRKKVAAEVDSYCARTLSGDAPIVGRNAVLSSGPMTLKDVAGCLGRGVAKVADIIDSQSSAIRGTRVTANGRRRRVVGEEDLARIAKRLEEAISVKEATRLLAMPAPRVRVLVHAGALSCVGNRVKRSEVVALASLPASVPTRQEVSGPHLDLRVALRNWIPTGKTAKFLHAVRSGELPVIESSSPLRPGHWRLSLAEVQAWVVGERSDETSILNLGEAAAAMSLKHEVVLSLVRTGLLHAIKGNRAGRQSWLISAADLAAFRARYVPLSRLTSVAHVRSRDGFAWARARGLTLVCGPRIDGSRQYFVDRGAGLIALS